MKYDYKEIKKLPDTFSLEDLRVVCHISKRTARFYLQTGLIACITTVRKPIAIPSEKKIAHIPDILCITDVAKITGYDTPTVHRWCRSRKLKALRSQPRTWISEKSLYAFLLEDYPIGKYGNLRHEFLKQHRKGTYTTLLTEFTLQKHLHDIDEEARQMIEELTLRIVSVRGGNEELKASDPLRWVQEMRNAKAAAEEIVLREVVYR